MQKSHGVQYKKFAACE
ncbi:unnamed protein product, partial [Allacma fusca]